MVVIWGPFNSLLLHTFHVGIYTQAGDPNLVHVIIFLYKRDFRLQLIVMGLLYAPVCPYWDVYAWASILFL